MNSLEQRVYERMRQAAGSRAYWTEDEKLIEDLNNARNALAEGQKILLESNSTLRSGIKGAIDYDSRCKMSVYDDDRRIQGVTRNESPAVYKREAAAELAKETKS